MKTFEQINNKIVGIRRFALLIAPLALLALVGSVGSVSANPKTTVGPDKITEIGQLRQAGWKLSYPPYPVVARYHHEAGPVYIVMTTDAKGRIAKINLLENPRSVESEVLRGNTLNYAKQFWSGPPNSTAKTKVEYHLR